MFADNVIILLPLDIYSYQIDLQLRLSQFLSQLTSCHNNGSVHLDEHFEE